MTKSQIGLDSAWGTTRWPIQVFYFFVAFTKVNSYLALTAACCHEGGGPLRDLPGPD